MLLQGQGGLMLEQGKATANRLLSALVGPVAPPSFDSLGSANLTQFMRPIRSVQGEGQEK